MRKVNCVRNYTYNDVLFCIILLKYKVTSSDIIYGIHNVLSGSLSITGIYRCEYFAVDYHMLKRLSRNVSSIQKVHPLVCIHCGLM